MHLRGELGVEVKGNAVSIRVARELVVSRLGMLCGADRDVMSLYYESGATKRQIAVIAGVHEATIGRKINKLTSALLEGVYVQCLSNRKFFTQEQLEVARLHFVGGMRSEAIGRRVGLGGAEVRGIIQYVRMVVGVAKAG